MCSHASPHPLPLRASPTEVHLLSAAAEQHCLSQAVVGVTPHTALRTLVFLCSRSTVAWPFLETELHLPNIACCTSGPCDLCPNAVFHFLNKDSKYRLSRLNDLALALSLCGDDDVND